MAGAGRGTVRLADPGTVRLADPGPETWLDRLGRRLAERLTAPSSGYEPYTPSDVATLERSLEPGDVLLVEGSSKVSTAIKYLTQSTWSHAALYVGDLVPDGAPLGLGTLSGERTSLIEANLGEGCVAVPLAKYESYNTRICRAVALTPEDREAVCRHLVGRLGLRYDLKNIVDMARYLMPTPPVPVRWRRRMLAFGSGEPTRGICSTLIAEGFQSIRYPILPRIERVDGGGTGAAGAGGARGTGRGGRSRAAREIWHIRHHSLFTPRDFDLSPYFEIVKPTIARGFDYKSLEWSTLPGGEDGERPNRPDGERPDRPDGERPNTPDGGEGDEARIGADRSDGVRGD